MNEQRQHASAAALTRFAEALRDVVRVRGVSDREVARRAGVQSPSTMVRFWSGDGVSLETVIRLARWADLSLDEHLLGTPICPNPLEEVGALRTRTEALAAEHDRLYGELVRLGRRCDTLQAEVLTLRARVAS